MATALLIGAGGVGFAQSTHPDPSARSGQSESPGSLVGKLTDLYSKPLGGVTVVLRNQATGSEASTITLKNGAYRFTGLEPGTYSLSAESAQLGRGQLEDIVVSAGAEAHVQAAMAFVPSAPGPALQPELAAKNQENLFEVSLAVAGKAAAPPPATPTHALAESGQKPATALVPKTTSATARVSVPASVAELAGSPLEDKTTQTREQLEGRRNQHSCYPWPPNARDLHPTGENQPVGTPDLGHPVQSSGHPVQRGSSGTETTLHPPPSSAKAAVAQPARPVHNPNLAAAVENKPVSSTGTDTTSAAELGALPISGRHWQDFVLETAPASVTPAGGLGQISLGGGDQQSAERTVDGMSHSLAFGLTGGSGQLSSGRGTLGQSGADPAGMAQVGIGGHGLAVSETAIREVRTDAGNVEAEADRAASGRMDVETQSGGERLHGQGFLFSRQNLWGAQNPFSQWVTETSSGADAVYPALPFPVFGNGPTGPPQSYTPPDREMTWGFGVGGRIHRKNLFWFAALDSFERNDPGVSMVKWPYLSNKSNCPSYATSSECTATTGFFAQPSNDEMQVLSARLGLSIANPVAEGLAAYSKTLESLAGLLGPAPRTNTQWTGFARIDWQATERQKLTLEGTGAYWNAPGGGLGGLSENYGNHSFGSTRATEEWLDGRWEAFLTPNLLSVVQVAAGSAVQQARPGTPSTFEQGFLQGNAWGQLPQMVVDSRYGFTIGNPSRFGKGDYPDEHSYQAQEQLDWAHGKLLVRSGFQWFHSADATSLLRNQTGTYHYASVENFISDALVFEKFGLSDALDPDNQHNCDQTGRAWRDSSGTLRGLGNLPCYSSYSQTLGPAGGQVSTNDWGGYSTAQWQAPRWIAISAGLRWEREELPPPVAALENSQLPQAGKLPSLGNQWAPRLSLAVGNGKGRWPLLRLGYGMYYGRTTNLAVETALTQTGSPNGDLNFFMRPTDDCFPGCTGGGAPPFPYVLVGDPGSVIKPGAVEFAPRFRNPEVHQAVVSVEEKLPGGIAVTASAIASLGRRLPISIDTNLAPPPANLGTITYNVVDGAGAGPIKTPTITVPFYASWPSTPCTTTLILVDAACGGRNQSDYQQITQIESRANSTYEAAMLRVAHYGRRGLSFHAYYVYAHAMDWNPNESARVAGNDVLDPADFSLEYGTSSLDVRHAAGVTAIYRAPWKLGGLTGKLGNGWMVSGMGHFRGGLPYTMRTTGSLATEFDSATGAAIVGLGPGMNGSGGDNRVYGVGRNTYRYPFTWKVDLRIGRRFNLGGMRQLELLAESFNLFNHQNMTELETSGYMIESAGASNQPTLNFMTGPETNAYGSTTKAASTAFGQPLKVNATNAYRARQLQFGLRFRF